VSENHRAASASVGAHPVGSDNLEVGLFDGLDLFR
jgi:hypothetical protein